MEVEAVFAIQEGPLQLWLTRNPRGTTGRRSTSTRKNTIVKVLQLAVCITLVKLSIYPPPQKQAPALATMSFRPGDGVPLPANVKRDIEALRESNFQVGLGDKQQEFDDFMESNWSNWKDNWHGYYGSLASSTYVGSTITSLPKKHAVIEIGEITYYHADGVYYALFGEIYVVVPPPNGALIKTIPPGLSTVTVNDTEYYNYGGAFYIKVDNGYQVIAPPAGGIVTELPGKAYSTLINKDLYYIYGNAYYKRFFRGNSVIYKIVKAPAVKKNL